jgi:hypothetical protein
VEEVVRRRGEVEGWGGCGEVPFFDLGESDLGWL